MEDHIKTGFGGYFVLDATAFWQHECVVCTFLGVLYVGCRCAKCQKWKLLGGGIGGSLKRSETFYGLNVKGVRPQIIFFMRSGSYLGPSSNAKRN